MRTTAYWTCTALVAFLIGSGGLAYLTSLPAAVEGVRALGFPAHFVLLLGAWKLLGAVAIVAPGTPLIKEWAYFGIMLDLTGAAYSSVATGAEWWHVAAPLSIALLAVVSWLLRPDGRRLPGTPVFPRPRQHLGGSALSRGEASRAQPACTASAGSMT